MRTLLLCAVFAPSLACAGPFALAPIAYDSTSIIGWASGYQDLVRGPFDITQPLQGNASHGSGADALGVADAALNNALTVVSLGDGGRITLTFDRPIANGLGADFAVFENGFDDSFLELAVVAVSSGGIFVPFRSVSLTPTTTQIGSEPNAIDPTNLNNLAGKYSMGFGTPFDLAELAGTPGLDINNITQIRITDVVGSINPAYGTLDSLGNLINDPWPTPYGTGGFDLDAVGVLNFAPVPEPCTPLMLMSAALIFTARRRR